MVKTTNSTTAKLHLQNINSSFAALQKDLKSTVKTICQLQEELRMSPETEETASLKSDKERLETDNERLKSENENLKSSLRNIKSDIKDLNPQIPSKEKELEEQLKIALSQISEIKIAYEKEKVRFLLIVFNSL